MTAFESLTTRARFIREFYGSFFAWVNLSGLLLQEFLRLAHLQSDCPGGVLFGGSAFDDGRCRVGWHTPSCTVGNQLSQNAAEMESHLPILTADENRQASTCRTCSAQHGALAKVIGRHGTAVLTEGPE
jgi:hypothetical protein